MTPLSHPHRCVLFSTVIAGITLVLTQAANAQQPSKPHPNDTATQNNQQHEQTLDNNTDWDKLDFGYDDEPPVDFYERHWRRHTRFYRPHRFSHPDIRRRFGHTPRYYRYRPDPYYDEYPYSGYYEEGVALYLQGRHDERKYRDWKKRHDKGKKAFAASITNGVRMFQEADYQNAARQFLLAARLNQGDPASRLHGAYALVAIGNYEKAADMVYEAIKLQSKLPYLPLDIRSEYGREADYQTHFDQLEKFTNETKDNPRLWLLLGFYQYYSDNPSDAMDSMNRARELSPRDRVIMVFYDAVELANPSVPPPATDPKNAEETKKETKTNDERNSQD